MVFSYLIEILRIVLLLKLFYQRCLFLLRQGLENEDRFISYVVLQNCQIKVTTCKAVNCSINNWNSTLIGCVNFLPANTTKSAIHTPSKVSFVPSSIKPLCTHQKEVHILRKINWTFVNLID